ncbi:MAG: hypothetical protein HY897_01475 [Deltaproteobacteria bacterium]|nr:hypothetical protein [Deltaproteobacteria bacterium]
MLLLLSAIFVITLVSVLGYSMVGWAPFEMRWRDALLGAMLPGDGDRPGFDDIDLREFWAIYDTHAPPLVRIGLRAATWFLTFLPLFVSGCRKPFFRLDADRRDRFLRAASSSRFYLVRQLMMTVKTFAAFGYFSNGVVRGLFGIPSGTPGPTTWSNG